MKLEYRWRYWDENEDCIDVYEMHYEGHKYEIELCNMYTKGRKTINDGKIAYLYILKDGEKVSVYKDGHWVVRPCGWEQQEHKYVTEFVIRKFSND